MISVNATLIKYCINATFTLKNIKNFQLNITIVTCIECSVFKFEIPNGEDESFKKILNLKFIRSNNDN